jgi:hypothetical protein
VTRWSDATGGDGGRDYAARFDALAASDTEPAVVARVAAHVAPGGLLVAGFGLDRAHLPPAGAVVDITAYDCWCADAGLLPVRRLATWDGAGWTEDAGYAVSVHGRPEG